MDYLQYDDNVLYIVIYVLRSIYETFHYHL